MGKRKIFEVSTENIVFILLLIYLIVYPFLMNAFKVLNMANFLITVLLSLSLSLIWGYTGVISFAQAAFFGLGGYTYAILAKNFINPSLTPLFLILGVGLGFAVALTLGYFMFYGGVNDVFVSIITLCFTLVLETFMAQTAGTKWKIGKVPLGGFNGINKIPPLSIGSIQITMGKLYLLVTIIVLVVYLWLRSIEKNKIGYTLISIRENRNRSEMLGYNISKIQMVVFGAGGAIAALSGVLYTTWGGYIVPSSMGMAQATIPLVLVAAGGRKNPTAIFLFTLLYLNISQRLAASGSEYSLIILGVILLLVILFVPKGIFHSSFEIIDKKANQINLKINSKKKLREMN